MEELPGSQPWKEDASRTYEGEGTPVGLGGAAGMGRAGLGQQRASTASSLRRGYSLHLFYYLLHPQGASFSRKCSISYSAAVGSEGNQRLNYFLGSGECDTRLDIDKHTPGIR